MKKRKWIIVTLLFITLLFFYVYMGLLGEDVLSEDRNYDYFIKHYDINSVDQVLELVEIKKRDAEIQFNNTNQDQTIDKNNCNLLYDVRIKNVSNEAMSLHVRYLIPKELYETIVYSRNAFGSLDDNPYDLEVGKGFTSSAGPIMKHYDLLDENELKIFDAYKNDLWMIITLDQVEYFVKMDDLKIEQ